MFGFAAGLLEYPHFTRPADWQGRPVWILRRTPEMLAALQSETQLVDPHSEHSRQPAYAKNIVTGFGETGPLKDKAGYDQVLQTMTGMCTLQGPHGGPPEILYGSVVDYYAAALVSGGVSSALYERERSGLGQYVGVSLLRSAMADSPELRTRGAEVDSSYYVHVWQRGSDKPWELLLDMLLPLPKPAK